MNDFKEQLMFGKDFFLRVCEFSSSNFNLRIVIDERGILLVEIFSDVFQLIINTRSTG